MRTRLDEIVEEETGEDASPGWHVRIAERAFRHGVEQCVASPDWTGLQPSRVQPAPAEEKCRSCWHTPHPGSPCSSGLNECDNWRGCDNRRKGERRKVAHLRHGYTYFYPDGPDTYRRDRRSGSDRRRP
jgi:hypothetical protein